MTLIPAILFYLFAATAVVLALGVIVARNPIYSALSLIGCLFAVAGIFALQSAQLMAVLQILVYAGAIMVLILFVIMLIGSEAIEGEFSQQSWLPFVGLGLGLVLLSSMLYTLLLGFQDAEPAMEALQGGAPAFVVTTLYTQYILPVEIVAVLLLVALIGALLLARDPASVE